jgi:hypothetical protein
MTPQQADMIWWAQSWLVLSIGAILPAVWALTLTLHFAAPAVMRHRAGLGLRLGSDTTWLVYVIARDGAMLLTLALSAVYLFPNIYLSQFLDIPITAPVSALVLVWALLVKLMFDADESAAAFRAVSLLLLLGAILVIVPEALGVQAVQASVYWDQFAEMGWIVPPLIASLNPDAATTILGLTLAGLGLTAVFVFVWFLRKAEAVAAAKK